MILSRLKPGILEPTTSTSASSAQLSLESFLEKRDYTGALTLLTFQKESGSTDTLTDSWFGYCYFHLGLYKQAVGIYETLRHLPNAPEDTDVNLACCYFYLGMHLQANQVLEKVAPGRLKTRLLFHLSHKLSDEKSLMEYHQKLEDSLEEQLCLASIHYLRSHYQEAIDIYKRILLDHKHLLAVNVYSAMCYYKLDYYDVSQEQLAVYLAQRPTSRIALNLKACNTYKLFTSRAAENQLKPILGSDNHDLIKHNLVVFKGGEGALQVLPPLIDIIPESRLNLVIYHLKQEENQEAFDLIKDLEPSVPQEYILKAVVQVTVGQETGSRDMVKAAQALFQLVGSSQTECDTVPGRQCMASSFFLQRSFKDVVLYLSSIKSYYTSDDSFNFNFAQAKCALGQYKEAEEMFLLVKSEDLKNDFVYVSHLTKCYIMNNKCEQAWDLYSKLDPSQDSLQILQLIANETYRRAAFWFAFKAFDALERAEPLAEYWEGKRGACAGLVQLIMAGKENRQRLSDVVQLLRNSSNSQVEGMIRTIKKWAKDNRINI
uniref:Intraflagellar transport protein 56 n=1 Tax=Cacopsylla melanoneura TaxID=428564 RepID=A0A8D9E4S6_9HEMI